MIITRRGIVEIPMPNLDVMIQTIRASIYGSDAKIKAEMKFRKTGLYDILKSNYVGKGKQEDADLLYKLWILNPEYLEYCVSSAEASHSTLSLLTKPDTLEAATSFSNAYLAESHLSFMKNSFIICGLIDGMGFSVAKAVYLGSYFSNLSPLDIINSKVLGVTPEEVEHCKINNVVITEPYFVKKQYLEIKKATNSMDSLLFASTGIPTKFSIFIIQNDIKFSTFMQLVASNTYSMIKIMHKYDIDSFMMAELSNSEALDTDTQNLSKYSLCIA